MGVYLRLRFVTVGNEAVGWAVDAMIVILGIRIGLGILAEDDLRYALGTPFNTDDTTEDH